MLRSVLGGVIALGAFRLNPHQRTLDLDQPLLRWTDPLFVASLIYRLSLQARAVASPGQPGRPGLVAPVHLGISFTVWSLWRVWYGAVTMACRDRGPSSPLGAALGITSRLQNSLRDEGSDFGATASQHSLIRAASVAVITLATVIAPTATRAIVSASVTTADVAPSRAVAGAAEGRLDRHSGGGAEGDKYHATEN